MEYSINEITSMICENDDDVKEYIYHKYSYIIDIVLRKYKRLIYKYEINYAEIKQEALIAFDDAIKSYDSEKNASLARFITVVINHQILNYIRDTSKKYHKEISINSVDNLGVEYIEKIVVPKYNTERIVFSKLSKDQIIEELLPILSSKERDVLILKLEGYNNSEIKSILNMNLKNIYNTCIRIKNKTAYIIEKYKLIC